jgi:ketosteroid isomerase-like protein
MTPVSQRDVDSMRAGYEALSRGDVAGVLELMDAAIEVRDRPESPDPRTYRGHEGVLAALQQSFETFEEFDLIPERFVEADDQIVVVLRMQARGRGSGVPVEDRIAHLWTLREGKAVALQVYSEPGDALEAAGAT